MSGLIAVKVITTGRGGKYDVDATVHPNFEPLKDLNGGNGVDVAIDTTGDPGPIKVMIKQLAVGGRVVVITTGSASGSTETAIEADFEILYRKQQSIIGCNSVDMNRA